MVHVPVANEAFPVYRFDEFQLDTGLGTLNKSGRSIRVRPRSFQVLRYLLEHPGRLVSKDELIEALWAPAVVTDGALTQCLMDVRRALGDKDGHLIETVPRRGYVLHAEVVIEAQGGQVASGSPGRPLWPILAGAAVVALVLVGAWQWPSPAPVAPAPPISVAVMPFVDLSAEGDQAYLADGLAEDVLTRLARSPALAVTARTSSFALRSELLDVPTIAHRLGVAYVLEGSVRRWGDRLRVAAQLIEAESGMHRWSEVYDRHGADVLELQLEIAAAVAEALRVELAPAQREPDIDPRAYALYLQGRHLRFQVPPNFEQAESLLKRALEIQPDFAEAHVQLAYVYFDMDLAGFLAVDGVAEIGGIRWDRIEQSINTASAINPREPGVSLMSGLIARMRDRDWTMAIRHFERAFETGPGIPIVDFMPILLDLYQVDTAIAYGEHLVTRDPLCVGCFGALATAYLLAGRLDDAQAANDQGFMLLPGARGPRVVAAEIQIRQGNPAEALALLEPLEADDPSRLWGRSIALHRLSRHEEFEAEFEEFRIRWGDKMPDAVAAIHARTGNVEAAFQSLDEIDTYVATRFVANYHDYYWAELAHDPRWRAFQEKWGVAPAQLARHRMKLPTTAIGGLQMWSRKLEQ